ncbi:MAG: hypothetical protein IJ837_02985 [Clostridia bacterium]|nr:hypothetical protein [Clostridia bacterium]
MTRKEISTIIKKYGLSLLISVPIVFVVDIFLLRGLSSAWIIVIDCALIALFYVLFLILYQKRKNYITKKRVEFLHKKELQRKQELEEEKQKREQEEQEQRILEEQKPKKIIQKQKRNYTNNKPKKRKKK